LNLTSKDFVVFTYDMLHSMLKLYIFCIFFDIFN
jgi:hypothetical protein